MQKFAAICNVCGATAKYYLENGLLTVPHTDYGYFKRKCRRACWHYRNGWRFGEAIKSLPVAATRLGSVQVMYCRNGHRMNLSRFNELKDVPS